MSSSTVCFLSPVCGFTGMMPFGGIQGSTESWSATWSRFQAEPIAAQIFGSSLAISNQYCDLDFSGTYISSMRLDGTGSGSYQSEWLSGATGYRWYKSDGTLLQSSSGEWVNVTATITGGNSTDGVYRLVANLGTSIEATTTVWLNGSELVVDYSFKILETVGIMKDGWMWVFNETLDKYSPSLVDAVWSLKDGGGRFFMTMHEMMRRPFHYIWGQGCDTYWYQGKGSAGATVEMHVPAQDEAHLFLNEGNNLVITTYPWDAHVGASSWTALAMTVVNRTFTIDVHPQGNIIDNAPADYPRFTVDTSVQIGSGLDSMDYGDALTRFFWERVYTYPAGADGNWIDWSSSEFAWNTKQFLEETKQRLGDIPITNGHVSSWNWLDGWPFPDNDSNMNNANYYDTRHPTTNPNYITAAWRVWQWTGNDTWLFQLKPQLDSVRSFFVNMLVDSEDIGDPDRVASVPGAVPLPPEAEGLYLCDWEGHHGASGGIGSNYWDIQPFGWLDSYSNAIAYAALLSLADFEAHWGNASGAASYIAKAIKLRESYTKLFWNDIFGRFIGCVDAWGNKHDYGFTFINQQAASYGLEWGMPLVDSVQVIRMYDWMENEPTGSGLKDTFSTWIYAARANTDINSRYVFNSTVDGDWWVAQGQMGDEGYSLSNPWPWAATKSGQLQNGGCSVYTSYHDLMARAYYINSDDAEHRIRDILNRWVLPDHICGGSPLYLGENPQQENAGAVGTDYPFPESGLVPTFLVYGFMGMLPRWKPADGGSGLPAGHVLVIDPLLPSGWNGYSANNLQFGGTVINVSVNTTTIAIEFPIPVSPVLQVEVNGTRYNVSAIVDVNGRAVIIYDTRQVELERRASVASEEYDASIAASRTINATGQQDLRPVPDFHAGATLDDILAWRRQAAKLMNTTEYNAIIEEIEALVARTTMPPIRLVAGQEDITRQRAEAEGSMARGDLRWVLGNYRQAMVIMRRIEGILQAAAPGITLQWFVVPALAIVAVIVIVNEVWRSGKRKERGLP